MRYVASLRYTEQLVRSAVVSFWKRTVGWKSIVALGVTIAVFLWLVISGDRSWWIGALGAALLFEIVVVALIYFVHLRQSMAKFRSMPNHAATFVAEADTFTASSEIGSSTFRWSSIVEVWKFEGYWLLLFSRAQFMTLPLDDVPAEMQRFVLDRIQASRGAHVG